MFAPDAQRSLISFHDLWSHGIHALTALKDGEETLKLRQGQECLVTARCGVSGLYEIPISCPTRGQQDMQPLSGSAYFVTIPDKAKLWHGRMGHPGTTMFRRMLPQLTGHEVCLSDASKVGACEACAQGKLILKPSRWKLPQELPPPLHRLHGDICGPIAPPSRPFRSYSGLKLQRALYGLRQADRMWYPHLHSFLIDHKFQHSQSLPCIFTLRESSGFAIVAIYVDDINLVGTPATCKKVVNLLIKRFKMKLLGRTSFFLGLQVANLQDGSIFASPDSLHIEDTQEVQHGQS